MEEITFYSYKNYGRKKKQIFITIDYKNKIFRTNKEQNKFNYSRYGFSSYELKDYTELKSLEKWLIYKDFKEEPLESEVY